MALAPKKWSTFILWLLHPAFRTNHLLIFYRSIFLSIWISTLARQMWHCGEDHPRHAQSGPSGCVQNETNGPQMTQACFNVVFYVIICESGQSGKQSGLAYPNCWFQPIGHLKKFQNRNPFLNAPNWSSMFYTDTVFGMWLFPKWFKWHEMTKSQISKSRSEASKYSEPEQGLSLHFGSQSQESQSLWKRLH